MIDWNFLKENVYFCDGSWRDIYIQNIQVTDWQTWVEYVNKSYRIEWYNGKTEKIETQIDFEVIRQYWEGEHDLCSGGSIFLNNIKLNVHFFDDEEIENDLDPDNFKSIEDHYCLMKYLVEVSLLLNKAVIVTPENLTKHILIKVDGENVEIPIDVNPPKFPSLPNKS